eukprot:TRINITY_DN14127_c0_g2_i3.p1 TRINITY_DN14127_c0_g2~~TRINITY_DN14127_c0_g2_i3.p1  ORF type:complete len:761 (-),score=129.69 TRINITY_DN14127_c0_g2_i3:576-2780(-)
MAAVVKVLQNAESCKKLPPGPSPLLKEVMQGMESDGSRARARAVARNMSRESYSLADYHKDLLEAFPELRLYGAERITCSGDTFKYEAASPSGRQQGEEYQRTVGAFFAIYWLVRMDHDGKSGFCYGVDGEWRPLKSAEGFSHDTQLKRCNAFYEDVKIWDYFRSLLFDSEIFVLEDSKVVVNENILALLLIITAVHDIMKISALLPTVQEEDGPFRGYSVGVTITDHDVALSYIIEHHTSMLPSLSKLEPWELALVRTILSGLAFNNGWLVQAEAPPGAVLGGIKGAISGDQGQEPASKRDLSIYFMHWLTDLAGAEPTPLRGCQKLTSRFPLFVLHSFMHSLKFVQWLGEMTETEVIESYLKTRWQEYIPPLGPVATGPGALTRMRLVCMAQGMAPTILSALEKLQPEDSDLLNFEMALTACAQQSYSPNLVPEEVIKSPVGPAFLVYYGPAFFQRIGGDCPTTRLSVLAEMLRRARKLWPASPALVDKFVTIRIDAITVAGVWNTSERDTLVLRKINNKEARIERNPDMSVQPGEAGSFEILFDVPEPTKCDSDMPSQADMIEKISKDMLAHGKWYRKVAHAFLRNAVPGEVVVTVVNGKEETVNKASYGDFVVQAQTVWKEQYILPHKTVIASYALDEPLPIQEDNPDFQQLVADGFKCYTSRTRIKALEATQERIQSLCPQGEFLAKWGSPVAISNGDVFAAQIGAEGQVSEVYRIEKTAFQQTFRLDR